jgi:hypothetical protein
VATEVDPVMVVAVNGRSSGMPTLDATRRRDPGSGSVACDHATAGTRLHAHDHEHMRVDDMANPSGLVDLTLGFGRRPSTGTPTGALSPDPWISLTGRGDGRTIP